MISSRGSLPGAILIAGLVPLWFAGGVAGFAAQDMSTETESGSASPEEFAAACESWDDWDKPAPPFRIHGGTYHVGTCGITAILITSPEGHLLIDAGTEPGAEVVAANIERLGFSIGDVRTLTHTQEHWDHVGGMAYLKERTGAKMAASPRAAEVFESGLLDPEDPQYGLHEPMATVAVDRFVADGEAILVGATSVTAHHTPGHSPGAISWRWEECQDGRCLTLVFTDGMSPVAADEYRWSDHPDYLTNYLESIEWLGSVDADICLAAHPSQTRLIERIEAGALVDPAACGRTGTSLRERIDAIVDAEGG